jgi:hypothetical protein
MTIAVRPECNLLVNRQRKTVVAGLDPAIHGPGEVEMALGEAAMMKGSLPAGRPVGIGPSFAYLARGWPVNPRIRSGTVMTTGRGSREAD